MTQPEQPSFTVPRWVFGVLRLWFRTAYKFEMEGVEHLPTVGPVILLPTDIQGFLGPFVQMLALPPVMDALKDSPGRQVSFLHEQLYAIIAKRMSSAKAPIYGVRPHDAGTQGLSLLDGYRALREGGLVNLNPEGDQSWDGTDVGIKQGCAWLALRSGAPCVLVAPTAGVYDIWPFWERGPSLRGRMNLRYSKPFSVTDRPLEQVTDDDLARAKAIIASELAKLRYGPEGVAAWAKPPRLKGEALAELPALRRHVPDRKTRYRKTPAVKQGIGLLLFQCPICGATDSLVHRRGLLWRNHVSCRACNAKWLVKRELGHDLRLILTRGPAELLGLDVALSQLHAYVKEHLELAPVVTAAVSSVDRSDQPLLVARKCKLMPYDLSLLQQPLASGRAPTERTEDHLQMPSSEALGVGELTMTAAGMVWHQDDQALEFDWDQVKAMHLYFRNIITVAHGAALYTMTLGDQGAIKWIAYADKLLNSSVSGADGSNGQAAAKRIPVSPY